MNEGVKRWAVCLVWRSWEQYAPDAVNFMQCGGRNLPSVLSDLWRELAWRACGVRECGCECECGVGGDWRWLGRFSRTDPVRPWACSRQLMRGVSPVPKSEGSFDFAQDGHLGVVFGASRPGPVAPNLRPQAPSMSALGCRQQLTFCLGQQVRQKRVRSIA
jgi:hypothetical protein